MKEIQNNEHKLMAELLEKRVRYVALQLLVMLLSLVIIPFPALAISYADYPYSKPAGSYDIDAWNFYQCECTSYVAWCLNNRNGISFHNLRKPGSNESLPTTIAAQGTNGEWYYGRWGHANNWKNAAEKLGYTVNTTPAVGAVYWTWNGSISSTGHVAWVSAVNGNKVTIEQYNAGWVVIGGEYHGNHKFSSETFDVGTKGEKYIHIKDINPEVRGSEMSSGYDRVLPDGDYLIAAAGTSDKSTFYYLDIEGTARPAANDTNVSLCGPLSGDPPIYEIWTITYNSSDKFYTIKQKGTNICLDVYCADTLQGTNVQVYTSNNGSAQKWAIKDNGRNGYQLQPKCSGGGEHGMCLDIAGGSISNGTQVRQWEINNSDAQSWLFIPYQPSQTLSDGRYILLSGVDNTKELDVPGDTGDVSDKTTVQLWNDGALSQYNSFDITKLGNGYYKIIHHASGKALEVYGGGSSRDTSASLFTPNGSNAQQWAITKDGYNGGYMLRVKSSGYALDLANAATSNGSKVRQYPWNGSKAETWSFVPAEYTVTFNLNGGAGNITNQTKYYHNPLTLTSAKPTRTGYDFLGWATSASATAAVYQSGGSYTADANVTLYAVWKLKNYQITYNANGGANPPVNQTKQPGEAVVLSAEIPTWAGYTFLGWARSADTTSAEYQPGDAYSTDADLTLYAVWKITNPPILTGSNFNLLVGDSRSWRDFVTLSHDGVLSYTLQASASGGAIGLNGDQVTAKAVGTGTITVKVVEYPAAFCTLSVEVVDLSTILKLPAALTAIEAEAFENSGIIAVNLPAKCVSIGNKAFANNRGLVYAFIPKSVTDIASDAFAGCPNLIIYCYGDSDAYYYAKSKGIRYQVLSDEWILANEVPLGATVTDEKWTYKKTVTETKTSTDTSMDGWTRGDYTWEKTKDGSYDFAVFPDGFDTGHALYSKYAVPSVPAETKRELGSTAQKSYIYWHWCFIDACAASDTDHNVLVEDARRTNVNISGSVKRAL